MADLWEGHHSGLRSVLYFDIGITTAASTDSAGGTFCDRVGGIGMARMVIGTGVGTGMSNATVAAAAGALSPHGEPPTVIIGVFGGGDG